MKKRADFVLDVLELYDEIDRLNKELADAKMKKDIADSANEESSPVYEMLVMAGIQAVSKELISSWYFDNYAPKVVDSEGNILSYDKWKVKLKPSNFSDDDIMKYIAYSKVTFEDLMRVLDAELLKFYKKKLGEQNENV